MKNKEVLFSKNNYDVRLEEVLENKNFDDEAKSLILSILYKIESAYKDYSKVKVFDVKLKNEIIEDIINIIESKCNEIEILSPKKSKSKFLVNKKSGLIKTFPTEVNLLQALYYAKTQDSKTIKDIFNKAMVSVFNKGFALNNVEIIRDFNGWSWNNVIDDKTSKYYNLIYLNLILLLGSECMNNILRSEDVRECLNNKINEIYGEKKSKQLIEILERCCILLYVYNNTKRENEISKKLKEKQSELENLANKSEYISKITVENNKNMKIVSKIETILKSETLLMKNFSRGELSKKYKTIEDYKNYLIKNKDIKLKEINKNTNLINPFEYVKRKQKLEREVKILIDIIESKKNEDFVYNNLIDLQRKVISCFYRKIEVYDLKKELINLIYEIRYYNLLPVEGEKKIKDIKELEVDMRNMQKEFINKLCDSKVIDAFAKDYNINYEILKYIFVTKMININKIQIKIRYEEKKLYIEYYDENVLEKENAINFTEDDLNELSKKLNKIMRIFI